jgi:hypothetical protein
VGDGATDFTPSPAQSREIIGRGYSVPRTLLVRFADDGIDESPALAALLADEAGPDAPARASSLLTLPGTHVTPCGSLRDYEAARGAPFSPLAALALAARAGAAADLARTADRIAAFLDASVA